MAGAAGAVGGGSTRLDEGGEGALVPGCWDAGAVGGLAAGAAGDESVTADAGGGAAGAKWRTQTVLTGATVAV